jgi:peptidoglycan/xylan/chitin deacetylase (PgdA/CDA1 family)
VTEVLVLCYHAVSRLWPADLAVRPARLESQLRMLLRQGYRGATFHQAIHAPPASKVMAVTFDDAYRSVIELGLPVLSRLGLPGTVFVPTAFAGVAEPMSWPGIDGWLGGPHEQELTAMSWSELATLAAAGWEIGSHTRTHPRLVELGDADLAEELAASRRECESRLGLPCRSLAYPYGAHDERVVRATAEAGYSAAGTLPDSRHPASPLRWPRIGVYRADDGLRFRVKTSPLMLGIRANGRLRVPSTAWRVARYLRGSTGEALAGSPEIGQMDD